MTPVLNRDVRVRAGVNGTIAIMGAYCSRCRQDSSPNTAGECGFCDGFAAGVHVTLPEEPHEPAKRLLETLGATYDVLEGGPAPKHLTAAPEPAQSPPSREEIPMQDEKAAAVAALQAYARENGEPPSSRIWRETGAMPTEARLRRLFGSWAEAIEAAGFPRPTRGGAQGARAARPARELPSLDAGIATAGRTPPPASNGDASFASRAHRLIEVHALIATAQEQLLDLQAEALNLLDDLKAEIS